MENDDSAVQYAIGRSDTVAPGVGIDLEFDADVQTMSPEASEYETCYVTSHKGPCRVATYSRDGQLIATGSADASIKILDTERMLAKSAMPIEVRRRRGRGGQRPLLVSCGDLHHFLPYSVYLLHYLRHFLCPPSDAFVIVVCVCVCVFYCGLYVCVSLCLAWRAFAATRIHFLLRLSSNVNPFL